MRSFALGVMVRAAVLAGLDCFWDASSVSLRGAALRCAGVPACLGLDQGPLHHVPSHAVDVPSLHFISRVFSK